MTSTTLGRGLLFSIYSSRSTCSISPVTSTTIELIIVPDASQGMIPRNTTYRPFLPMKRNFRGFYFETFHCAHLTAQKIVLQTAMKSEILRTFLPTLPHEEEDVQQEEVDSCEREMQLQGSQSMTRKQRIS